MSTRAPHVSAAEAVQAHLRERITAGELPPGNRLVDTALAEEYGVSRHTVRDALRLLGADGLVRSVRNSGSSVRSLTAADVRDIYLVRRLMETAAVRQSAHADDGLLQDVERAATTVEQYARAGAASHVGTASLAFHRSLVALAGSARLNAFYDTIAAQLRLAFAVMPDEGEFQLQWVALDRQIADLVVSGRRTEAEARLLEYLYESEGLVVDGIRAAERAG
ncbi:GntR family transcriptional regulator [Cellulomonas fimi]|uniref:GntR family transcriptional regulator n=1 Tax=Cellulomonas fimi TaxID=1708 RepID=A0A7Y0LW16_CELFI|nr:GntR family transcriptional regulator [Cellulomonas fimi]NMR19272.1 GntR family transcriptional regulator [Cellulomonas fimi]